MLDVVEAGGLCRDSSGRLFFAGWSPDSAAASFKASADDFDGRRLRTIE